MNRKGFSAMIAVIILVSVASIISIGVFYFVDSYSKSQINHIENPDLIKTSQLRFLYMLNDNVTLYNPYENLQIRESVIEGDVCSSDNINHSKGPFQINISSCSSFRDETLLLDTNEGLFRINLEFN